MPRSRTVRGKLAAETFANGLIASARNLGRNPVAATPSRKVEKQDWQEEAWFWYDTIEVFHYGVQWVGNNLSRAKLIVKYKGEMQTTGDAVEVLNKFYGGPDQHGEFLRQGGIHMTVAGEGYIFAQGEEEDREWSTLAATEVKWEDDETYSISKEKISIDDMLLIRFWRPHPRKRWLSDCPTRPLLPILSQIQELTQYVSAQLDSRLSGAGFLKIPTEVVFPTQTTNVDGTTVAQQGVNGFIAELAATMAAAKQDRTSASSRVPTILQAPGEFLDKIDHLTLWSELDENAAKLRDEAIRRLALGMDMPPEALLGTADVNHWGAWQIEDSLIKSFSEPLLALLTQALTTDYLRVVLEDEYGMDPEESKLYEIEADSTEMRLRPNRSKEAMELHERGEISGATLRRENGFEETDVMDEDERKTWLLMKLAQGSPSPELVAEAARQLGVDITIPTGPDADKERGLRPLPRSLEEHPTQDIPDTQEDADSASLLASGEAALFHALTRAGNRLKSTSSAIQGIPPGVPAMDRYQYVTLSKSQLDHVLADAWPNLDRLTLPTSVNVVELEAALDSYALSLIHI